MEVASQHWTDWTVETIEINRKVQKTKSKMSDEWIGLDGWLSYTAVTPRASLKSDANNFLEITFSENATAQATSAPNELKICQFVNLIGFELHCFPSRLIFRTRTYMYYIYIRIRIYKMFGTFCHLSARQQMGSSCVQNFTFVGF